MIGTTVKSFQNEAWSWTSGASLGQEISPAKSFHIATPAMMTTNTTASATDNADVHFKESVHNIKTLSHARSVLVALIMSK